LAVLLDGFESDDTDKDLNDEREEIN